MQTMLEQIHPREKHMDFVPIERVGETETLGILLAWGTGVSSAIPPALFVPNGGTILQGRALVHGARGRMP